MKTKRALFQICLLGAFLIALPAMGRAQQLFQYYTSNGWYDFTITNDSITIFDYVGSDSSLVIPNTISNLPVTSIGDQAFQDFTGTNVTIGTNITCIGDDAFAGTPLISVTIPSGVTSIGNYAFAGASLISVTISSGVTNLGDYVFSSCTSLTNPIILNNVIGDSEFFYDTGLTNVIIPNSVLSIGDAAFYQCFNLASCTLGTNVTSISQNAFGFDSLLTSINIPASLTNLPWGTFESCTNVTVATANPAFSYMAGVLFNKNQTELIEDFNAGLSYTIPNSVTGIGDSAFQFATITNLTIPSSVTSIEADAFYYCQSLTSLIIPNSVTSIGDSAFSSDQIANITIPNSVTNLGNYAFSGDGSLTNVTLGTGLKTINDSMFYDSGLVSITIPDSVTSIGASAFVDCGLISITIPASVTNIGVTAFVGTNLKAVYFQGNAPVLGANVFYGDSAPPVVYYLPGTTGWGNFAGATGITPTLWSFGVQYTANPTNVPLGWGIQFTCPTVDSGGNLITNWNWNFGDGNTSTNQSPTHLYNSVGSFDPFLIAVNQLGTTFPGNGPAITVSMPPAIAVTSLSKTNLVISGSNGIGGLTNYVLMSTNLALPRSQWTSVATNIWSANGSFAFTLTNAVNKAAPKKFYLLEIP